jgi:hypothetical protein
VPYCQLLGIQSGKLFWNQNQKKIFIGRKIGYNVFADIVNEAGLLTDCESFDVILGTFMKDFARFGNPAFVLELIFFRIVMLWPVPGGA